MEAHFPEVSNRWTHAGDSQSIPMEYKYSRIIVELSGAIIGFLLGGPVGLGTLLIALVVGKIIQMTNRKIKKVIQLEGLPISQA